ncbi:bacillithiol biosynthesis cysteine-adding enzyme BshC [soil metagenome]
MTAASRPDILVSPLQGGSALVRDYLAGIDLSPFYTAHPGDAAAWADQAAAVDARLDATSRARVASAIQPLGDAAGRLDCILDGDGFFITTGQQPALFGGPLYTLYKILSAIRLAAVLEAQLERPVLALFWVGSDDHDWDEANHATFIDGGGYAERVAVPASPDAPPLPLSERVWGQGVTSAVDRLIELLPDGAYARDVAAHVRDAYVPDATVSASFTATITHLLGGRRLAIVDAAHPAMRHAAAPVLRHELEHAAEHGETVARQTQRLIDAGYHAQVAADPDAANIMLLDEAGRDRLIRGRGGWLTRRDQRPITEAALLRRLETEPDRFSPNVLLRPIVESALLPTIAYVAGPGELSYFAQIGCLFRAHGMRPPIVVPRASVTLVEPKVRKVLDAQGVEPSFFARPYAEVVRTVLHAELPQEVRASLASVRDGLHATYGALADAASEVDPTLRGPVIAARNAALVRVTGTEKKIVTQLGRRNEVLLERLRLASAQLHPTGAPQERVLGMLHYVARWGPQLIDEMESAIDMTPRTTAQWAGPECG